MRLRERIILEKNPELFFTNEFKEKVWTTKMMMMTTTKIKSAMYKKQQQQKKFKDEFGVKAEAIEPKQYIKMANS